MAEKFKIPTEDIDLLKNAKSDKELINMLDGLSTHPDKQRVMQETLGDMIEKRFGAEDIKSSLELDEYLQKIKQKDYPTLDRARRLINSEIPDIRATFSNDSYGNAAFQRDIRNKNEFPIRVGSVVGPDGASSKYTKALLGHELSHGNDTTVSTLRRAMSSMPDAKRAALQQKIDDLGSEQFSNHFKNTKEIYTPLTAGNLNPDNYQSWREMVLRQEPSPTREAHLDYIKRYEAQLKQGIAGNSFEQVNINKNFDIPIEKIPQLKGEGIDMTPDRAFMTKTLQSEMSPVSAEINRSSGHHLPAVDIPDDTGHYESRNIKGLLSGKGLRAMLPVLGMASQVVPSAVDLKEGNPNTAVARMVTGLAPPGSGDLDRALMDNAELRDKSPELLDPSYMKTLEAIGARRSREGRSPIVESFSGKQIDTSATEGSDFENLIKKKMNTERQG